MSDLRDDLLLWIDLETTGLDPQRDLILEVAVQLTDRDLVPIAEPLAWVVQQPFGVVSDMLSDEVYRMHAASGLLQDMQDALIRMPALQERLARYLDAHAVRGTTRAAGSSVHFDVGFLRYQLPLVYERLYYRQLNVSSIVETAEWWYDFRFEKQKHHRAYDDLQESLAELRSWKQFLEYRIAR